MIQTWQRCKCATRDIKERMTNSNIGPVISWAEVLVVVQEGELELEEGHLNK